MWYLYGGLLGDGVSISFTPRAMMDFVLSINSVYPVVNGKVNKNIELIKNRDFDVEFGWIYYADSKRRFNYRREWYQLKENEIEKFSKDNWFIKNYAWESECEFRIVVINKTNHIYDKLEIPLPKTLLSRISVKLGPEVPIDRQPFKKDSTIKVIRSNVGANMGLLKRNQDKVISYFQEKIHEWNITIEEKECLENTVSILEKYWKH